MKLIKKMAFTAIIAGIIPMTASVANAQSAAGYLTNVQGQVLIERGGALYQAVEQSALLAGDKVITGPNSSTNVTLNNCQARLQNTQAVNLGLSNHCANIGSVTNVPANYGVPSGNLPIGNLPSPSAANPALLIAGAGILAGAIIAIASSGGDDDDDAPVSP